MASAVRRHYRSRIRTRTGIAMTLRHSSMLFATILFGLSHFTGAAATDGYYETWPPPAGNGRIRLQPYTGVNLVTNMAIGADGHVVLEELYADSNADLYVNGVVCIVRLDADGSYDYTFGPSQNGRVCLNDFPSIPAVLSIPGTHSLAVQHDGKIVLAAQMYENIATSHISALVARLNVDGSLDATAAGGAGFQYFQFSQTAGAYVSAPEAVLVQANGDIVVAGIACNDTAAPCNQDFAAARFDSNLQFDAGFGSGGRTLVNFDLGGNNGDNAVAVVEDAAGIVLIGNSTQSNGKIGPTAARLGADGALDTSFGNQGRFSSQLSGIFEYATSGAIDANGRLLIGGAGKSSSGIDDYAVVRILTDGSGLDTSFGGTANGYTGSVPGLALFGFAPAIGGVTEHGSNAYGLAVQSDGRVVVAGQASVTDGANVYTYFGVARLMPDDGALDPSFGFSGQSYGTFGAGSDTASGHAVVFAPGNRMTIAGFGADSATSPTTDAGIARLVEDLIFFSAFEPPNNASNQ